MVSRARLAILFLVVILTVGHASSQPSKGAALQPLETETTAPTPVATPIATPTATPALELTATPVSVEGAPTLSKVVKVRDSEHFTFYAEPDSYAQRHIDSFSADAELLLQEMSNRLGERLSRRVSFYLYGANQGYFSALSFAGPSLIYQQIDAESSKARTKAVTAHELVHHLTFQSLGYPGNLIHLEGIAHWASESYWIRAEGRSFDERVRRQLTANTALSLANLQQNRALWKGETQQTAYDEAGSFVGYLIRIYGLNRFKQVYMESNYEEVYGRILPDLEKDWLASLKDR